MLLVNAFSVGDWAQNIAFYLSCTLLLLLIFKQQAVLKMSTARR